MKKVTIVACLVFALLLLPVGTAYAVDIFVDSDCSLKNAIISALAITGFNQAAPRANCEAGVNAAHDTIILTQDEDWGGSAPQGITSSLTIKGGGHTISGGSSDTGGGGLIITWQNIDVTIENVVISGNVATPAVASVHTVGGGINVAKGNLILRNSVIKGNTVKGGGGGLYMGHADSVVLIENSVISGNTANATGTYSGLCIAGGIGVNAGTLTIRNSTISGNTSCKGGGLFYTGGTKSVTLEHVTITGNTVATAGNGGGLYLDQPVPGTNAFPTNIRNTIISGNSGGDCAGPQTPAQSLGNYIGDGVCTAALDATDGVLNLGPLVGIGHYKPPAGSPIIQAAVGTYCPAFDAVGTERPPDSCTIGAIEYVAAAAAPSGGAESPRKRRVLKPYADTCAKLGPAIEVAAAGGLPECQRIEAWRVGIPALASVVIDAVDVWSWVLPDTQVCFSMAGEGIVFLDAAGAPRVAVLLPTHERDGLLCAYIDRAGTVALTGQAGAIDSPVSGLGDCMATTAHIVNFRDSPGGPQLFFIDQNGHEIAGWLPEGVTLTALARKGDWLWVDYYGVLGWISAHYSVLAGDCG